MSAKQSAFLVFLVASGACTETPATPSEQEPASSVNSNAEEQKSVSQLEPSTAGASEIQSAASEGKTGSQTNIEKPVEPKSKSSLAKASIASGASNGGNGKAETPSARNGVADSEATLASKSKDSAGQGAKKKPMSLEDALKAPVDVASPPDDAIDTPSGLASKVLAPGEGKRKPKVSDSVQINYTGWQTTGRMFDSSLKRGEPVTFSLSHVIEGWTEGVQLMVEGEKRRFWIPEALAYKGKPGAPSGMLVYDIELLRIIEVPVAPADIAEPPTDSDKRESGLATKLLRPGIGDVNPAITSTVMLHFTGWTTDGAMFDSSVAKGHPVVIPLNRAIPGWAEGIRLMVEGERRRLWVPEHLAYKGRPGAPAGTLVFDIELLKIDP